MGIVLLVSALRLMGSPSWLGLASGPWRAWVAFSRRVWCFFDEEEVVVVVEWLLLLSRSNSVGVRLWRGIWGDMLEKMDRVFVMEGNVL